MAQLVLPLSGGKNLLDILIINRLLNHSTIREKGLKISQYLCRLIAYVALYLRKRRMRLLLVRPPRPANATGGREPTLPHRHEHLRGEHMHRYRHVYKACV